MSNNNSDPLYPKQRNQSNNQSIVSTARQSRNHLRNNAQKKNNANTISKFVGELAKSLAREGSCTIDCSEDIARNQKISLLKRIIDHYNIKSVEKKYYSSTHFNTCRPNQNLWTENLVGQQHRHRSKEKHSPSRRIEIKFQGAQH